jgi:hypothetical protein
MRSFNKIPVAATFGDRFIEPAIKKSLQGFAAQPVTSAIGKWLSGENNAELAAWECSPAQGGSPPNPPVGNVRPPNPSTPLPPHCKGGMCCNNGYSPMGFTATPIGKNFQTWMRREDDDESIVDAHGSREDDCSIISSGAEDNESDVDTHATHLARLALGKRPMWHPLHTPKSKRRSFADGDASHPPWCKGAKEFVSGGYIDKDTRKKVSYEEDAADEASLLKCMVGSTSFNCKCKVAKANGYKQGCYAQIWIAMKAAYPNDNTASRILEQRKLRHTNKAQFKDSIGQMLRRRHEDSTCNVESITYSYPMNNSVVKVCEKAFMYGHHIANSTWKRSRLAAHKRHGESAALPRNVDPLYGDRKQQLGGSPHYRGPGGKVMKLIIKWAKSVLPSLAQIVPVIKRECGLLRCGCTACADVHCACRDLGCYECLRAKLERKKERPSASRDSSKPRTVPWSA